MARMIVIFAAALSTLNLQLGSAGAAPTPASAPAFTANGSAAGYCAEPEELAFLTIINDYRAQNGKGPLVLTQTLGAAADFHSSDMATKNYFSHTLIDGTTWSQNMTNFGYKYVTTRGENIAAGNAAAAAAFTQWKSSPGHDANMLNGNYNAIGIGRASHDGSTWKWYWTTTFGGVVDAGAATCGTASATTPTPSTTNTQIAIRSSGRTSNSNSSAYAYDRNTATAWATTTSTPPQVAQISFDLDSVQTIATAKWLSAETGFAEGWRLQVSKDLASWTTVATLSNAPARTWQSRTLNASARYVRFYCTNLSRDP